MDPALFYAIILALEAIGLILCPFLLYFLDMHEFLSSEQFQPQNIGAITGEEIFIGKNNSK